MEKNKIYFAGAGGIGMAALERYYLSRGCRVAGYDRTPTDLTRALVKEGVDITFDDSVEAIRADFRTSPEEVLVVYTPALPDNHPQLEYFRTHGYEVVKRAEVLGRITRDSKGICFAGPTARPQRRQWQRISCTHAQRDVTLSSGAYSGITTATSC